jgi:hypothetical protein
MKLLPVVVCPLRTSTSRVLTRSTAFDLRKTREQWTHQTRHAIARIVTAILAIALATNARADFSCRVNVQGVLPYYEGSLNVLHSGRNDWTVICDLNAPYTNGLTVSPTTCMAWMAVLLRAKKNNQPVEFWFAGTGSCATIGTYGSSPVPIYVGENN